MSRAPDTIGEMMTTDVVTVAPDDPVERAVRVMLDRDIGSVVVAEGATAVGMFTERDLSRRILDDPGLLGRPVREVMSSPVTSAPSSSEVVEAFGLMDAKRVRRIPVVDDGKLVGIVTERDLLHWVDQVAKE